MDMIAEILGKMNMVVTIISFIVIAIFLFLLYMAYGKIKDLGKAKANLRIEIDELKKELDKYSEVEIKIALTSFEKQMILNALGMPHYKARLQDPKTKFFIREMYQNLRTKIKSSIKE